jgi:chromosome segregation ATPase
MDKMRKEYVHLSIQSSKIPTVAARLEKYQHERSVLSDEISELRGDIEALENQTGLAVRQWGKAMLEFRQMMTQEEKLIADMQQKRQDVEAEFQATMQELEMKSEHEKRAIAKLEAEVGVTEETTAAYLQECEETLVKLRGEIENCEQMLEEVTRMSRNRRRLKEYEIPEYSYEGEDTKKAAKRKN